MSLAVVSGMSDPLATYLEDHLAGAAAAVNLLEGLRDQYRGEPLGQFASDMLAEVEEDRMLLQRLAERTGAGSNVLKDATAWMGEKVSRLKVSRHAAGDLGGFEALEGLALGILGKLALWRALSVIAAADTRLHGLDFEALARRAQAQHARVEERRVHLARIALRPAA